MMIVKTMLLAGVAALCLGTVGLAQEQLSGEAAIKARQELMRSNAQVMGSAADLTGAESVTAGETLVANFERLPTLFPEDSKDGKTRALPAIWENPEEFQAEITAAQEAAAGVLAAAQANDTAAYTQAIEAMGARCGSCHSTFRAPQG
jgi:cytochrome c556